jgi:hypothetical protein
MGLVFFVILLALVRLPQGKMKINRDLVMNYDLPVFFYYINWFGIGEGISWQERKRWFLEIFSIFCDSMLF